ncbi:regulatory protein GemA [bacterium]|nr:MAG: regulatory protein GemA [bacterium]
MTVDAHQAQRRSKSIAAIHVARQQLGMDEDAYRDMLERVSASCGDAVRSAAQLTDRQRQAVLDELRRKGAQIKGRPGQYPGKPHNFNSSAMPEMITKIEAQLADMKLSWAYADAIAKRQCGVAKVAWVRKEEQLKGIIAALDVEQSKRASNAYIDESVKRLGIGEKQFTELTAKLPKNWRRQLRCLRLVCDHLGARINMLDQKESEGGEA